MKKIYPKLALTGIRTNRRTYVPYFLSCAGMILMHYILYALSDMEEIGRMSGGASAMLTLRLGSFVIFFFSVLFLFYTNSFLLKQRKKEFGLYNILGMEKRHILCILFWENTMIAAASIISGVVLGLLFEKLAEIGLYYVMNMKVNYRLSISGKSMLHTVVNYIIIFVLLLVNAAWQVYKSGALELFGSQKKGEKPPKANVLLGLGGFVILAAAYYIAVTIKNPVSALMYFFVAVLMVILATYLLMISGSVLICKLLKKNKSYYYQANHFIAVSSMTYRMKRNGAGLASICILATGVLVMMSGSSCLYFGTEDSLKNRYPHEVNVILQIREDASPAEQMESWRQMILNRISDSADRLENEEMYYLAEAVGYLRDDVFDYNDETITGVEADYSILYDLYVFTADQYQKLTGEEITLGDKEILASSPEKKLNYPEIEIAEGCRYRVAGEVDPEFVDAVSSVAGGSVLNQLYVVMDNYDEILEKMAGKVNPYGVRLFNVQVYYGFDTGKSEEQQMETAGKIACMESLNESDGIRSYMVESRAKNRTDFYMGYGGLFFLGIMLSVVFLMATVLIIYFKQISEGYEDQSGFEIMQKIGMTRKEIEKSVYTQMRLVFFLPVIMAVLHLAFAFPMICRVLLLFSLNNTGLFIRTIGISILVFAAIYTLVYRITSREYIKIVSE